MSRASEYLGIKEDADYYGTPTAFAFTKINALTWQQKAYLACLMLMDAVWARK